nr:hypothetical protein [Tanacetum cinerariifolium]
DGAADVDAAGSDLDRHALEPAIEHRFQARQAACFLDTGEKDFLLEAAVIELEHFDLQVFARTEVGKDARLAHAHAVCEQADGQALETITAG